MRAATKATVLVDLMMHLFLADGSGDRNTPAGPDGLEAGVDSAHVVPGVGRGIAEQGFAANGITEVVDHQGEHIGPRDGHGLSRVVPDDLNGNVEVLGRKSPLEAKGPLRADDEA